MNDQCKHCMARGDMKVCRDVECFQHENWYAVELEKGISILQAEVRVLRKYRPEFMNRKTAEEAALKIRQMREENDPLL